MTKTILMLLLFLLCVICWFYLGTIYGYDKAVNEYAEKFPNVENFQATPTQPKYGDISIIGSKFHPCIDTPCVDMWNGKTWVPLVPKSECK